MAEYEIEVSVDTDLTLGNIGLGFNPMPKSNQDKPNRDAVSLNLSLSLEPSNFAIIACDSDTEDDSASDNDGENNNNLIRTGSRRKLRFTKGQTKVLDKEFKERSTLTHARKNELAVLLDLSPRQIEVWFQNRRARTKLKQVEVDCERWKKNYKELMIENWQLRRQVEEARREMQRNLAIWPQRNLAI